MPHRPRVELGPGPDFTPVSQKGETSRAYEGLLLYCTMPPGERTLAKVSAAMGHRGPQTVERWSVAHDWVDRAQASDKARFLHRQREYHKLCEAHDLSMLEMQLDATLQAKRILQDKGIARLAAILDGENPNIVPAAVRELTKLAGHSPTMPNPEDIKPKQIKANGPAELIKGLLDSGVPRALLKPLAAWLVKGDEEADDDPAE